MMTTIANILILGAILNEAFYLTGGVSLLIFLDKWNGT